MSGKQSLFSMVEKQKRPRSESKERFVDPGHKSNSIKMLTGDFAVSMF
jgi:hypothetical protein